MYKIVHSALVVVDKQLIGNLVQADLLVSSAPNYWSGLSLTTRLASPALQLIFSIKY